MLLPVFQELAHHRPEEAIGVVELGAIEGEGE